GSAAGSLRATRAGMTGAAATTTLPNGPGPSAAFARAFIAVASNLTDTRRREQLALTALRDATGAERISLMLRDGDDLRVAAAIGHDVGSVGRRRPRGEGLAWRVVTAGRLLGVAGVLDQAKGHYRESSQSLVVPVLDDGGVAGT